MQEYLQIYFQEYQQDYLKEYFQEYLKDYVWMSSLKCPRSRLWGEHSEPVIFDLVVGLD